MSCGCTGIENTMANVFISHRSTDTAIAEKIATDIRVHGHSVWLDVWELHLGDSLVERIDAGLQGASYLVMCLSADGVHTPWMSREWMSALARQLNTKVVKILPVKCSPGEPPAIMADVKYADATSDYAGAINAILKAIT
jgi:hypothetical protein